MQIAMQFSIMDILPNITIVVLTVLQFLQCNKKSMKQHTNYYITCKPCFVQERDIYYAACIQLTKTLSGTISQSVKCVFLRGDQNLHAVFFFKFTVAVNK